MKRRPKGPVELELSSPTLRDYALYQSGNEAPVSYHVFSLLAMAGALLECRVWLNWEYDNYVPNLYVCLVGPQGARKSTAAKGARNLLLQVDPGHPMGDPIISKESIITQLSSPEAKMSYQWGDKTFVYEPVTLVVTELKNSLAINPFSLVDWLTHVYEGENTSSKTVKRGREEVAHPVITLLACETTDWLVDKLRCSLISGGFSRRMLFVVEDKYGERIANPKIPPGGHEALARVRKRMENLKSLTGEVVMAKPARKWFDHWYETVQAPNHKMGRAWYTSKHVQLVKLAMILAALDDGERKVELRHLKQALCLLDATEPGMFRLLAMAGRNPLLAPTYELLSQLEAGPMDEHLARQVLFEWCSAREVEELLRHLQLTRQIVVGRNGDGSAVVKLAASAGARPKSQPSPAG